jgi:hypothetical protein
MLTVFVLALQVLHRLRRTTVEARDFFSPIGEGARLKARHFQVAV